jgi:predicted RND superfamily exporter protein
MKQTAVDYLFEKLWDEPKDRLTWYKIAGDAKDMEKEQIIEAHGKQLKKTQTAGNYEYYLTGEQYYKETYEENES